jgi:hypothetical protein
MPTVSGGLIELDVCNDRFHGRQLFLHIDQNANINNGEGECSIVINNNEIKNLIAMLNDYLFVSEGVHHVVLAEPLLHPNVLITVVDEINRISE